MSSFQFIKVFQRLSFFFYGKNQFGSQTHFFSNVKFFLEILEKCNLFSKVMHRRAFFLYFGEKALL